MDVKHYLIFGGLSFAIHSLAFSANYKPMVIAPVAEAAGKSVSIQFVSAHKPTEKITTDAAKPKTTPKSQTADANKKQQKQEQQNVAQSPVVKNNPIAKKTVEKPTISAQKAPVPKPREQVKETTASDSDTVKAVKTPKTTPVTESTPVETTIVEQPVEKPAFQSKDNKLALDKNTKAATSAPKLVTKPTFETRPSAINYPRSAKRRNIQGNVLIEVWLDENGEQTNLMIVNSSGHQILDSAALKGISEWEFRQHQNQGQAIAHRVQIPINFKLD
jgi:protein TonB